MTEQETEAWVRELHAGQADKAGKPYIEHVLRVRDHVEGEEARIVALLHDVMEDCGVTNADLMEKGYSHDIIGCVERLTHNPHETYTGYILRIASGPKVAREVKIADLRDNMNLKRIPNATEIDQRRCEKYEEAYELLTRVEILEANGGQP